MANKKSIVWTCENGKDFYPTRPVVKNLPSGVYTLKYSQDFGVYLSNFSYKNDQPLAIMDTDFKKIKGDLDKFMSLKDNYSQTEIEYNRAVLLHGEPGCGKKHLIRRTVEHFLKKHNGIVIYADEPTDLKKVLSYISEEDRDAKVMVILEDIGILLEKYGIPSVVSIFKSKDNVDGVYIIATTNYEERVGEYLSDKPGVFEEKFLIDYPSLANRKKYIKLLSEKFNLKIDIKKFSDDTDGLSLGHIKNLVESVCLFDYKYEDKLEELREMKENITSSIYSSGQAQGGIGF
jgi:SpoVK/Ycf46/Vps4 family AAA+-type ATPase